MKIEYIRGNLFDTDIKHILHGCNAQGVMGSGVARIIRNDYRAAYDEYLSVAAKYRNVGSTLPMGLLIPAVSNGKVIINAVTQHQYGSSGQRYVSYDAVATAMKAVEYDLGTNIDSTDPSVIAMPQIGAGLGGGDWDVIASIISSELKTVQPYVYIYEGDHIG